MRRYFVVFDGAVPILRIINGECHMIIARVEGTRGVISVAGVPVEEIPDVQYGIVKLGANNTSTNMWHISFPVKAGVTADDFILVQI